MAIGIAPEFNMNSRFWFAGGVNIGFDFNLPKYFSVGATVGASYNFEDTFVLEPAAKARWYFLRRGYDGFYVQADAGASLIFEEDELYPMILGGLRVGYRFPVGRSFYIEPYGRGGYPFVFGVGVMLGTMF